MDRDTPSEGERTARALMRVLLGDDVTDADDAISQIAGFRLTEDEQRPFAEFSNWLNTKPKFVTSWHRADGPMHGRHLQFSKGREGCRSGYAAALYHLGNIRQIEETVHEILGHFDFSKSISRNQVIAIGDLSQAHFEYQAFVMAYRRSLDALAYGLSAHFDGYFTSFKDLMKPPGRIRGHSVADKLADAAGRHSDKFQGFVMDQARGMSVRDRIAHKEAIGAAAINLKSNGHLILGGGENLFSTAPLEIPPRLTAALEVRTADLHACITDLLSTFQAAVTEYEASDD